MKTRRHKKILDIISSQDVETQEELARVLRGNGFEVTQATVSRDIRELMLTKTQGPDGNLRYAAVQMGDLQIYERYVRVFREGALSMECAGNMLVVRTLQGAAGAVAAAADAMENPEMVGCIAGDDIIFCVSKTEERALALMERFRRLMSESG
ncbi:MAG: arginine repressor [Clostridiales bacterium]|jgi:transcriptional regulator of arginine metabolism|nr:arginine repressor [Clostridiales bacterium]